jgi:hypothetical protein
MLTRCKQWRTVSEAQQAKVLTIRGYMAVVIDQRLCEYVHRCESRGPWSATVGQVRRLVTTFGFSLISRSETGRPTGNGRSQTQGMETFAMAEG